MSGLSATHVLVSPTSPHSFFFSSRSCRGGNGRERGKGLGAGLNFHFLLGLDVICFHLLCFQPITCYHTDLHPSSLLTKKIVVVFLLNVCWTSLARNFAQSVF